MTLKGVSISAPANHNGITVKADGVILDHVRVTGAQAATFRWQENCVEASGSTSDPISALVIKYSTMTRCGRDGMYLYHVTKATISSNRISNVVYAGIMLSTVTSSKVQSNVVNGVGVHGSGTNENNAYGISATSETGGPSSDIVISGNLVEHIPTWHGLDTHGGVRITFRDNRIVAVRRAIFLTSSPTHVIVDGNILTAPTAAQQAACPSDAPRAYCTDIRGISLVGGSATITDNVGHGYPSGRWWNPKGGAYSASGNSPRIQ